MSYLEISINKIGNHHLIFWFPNKAKYYDRKENLYDINSICMLAVEHVISLIQTHSDEERRFMYKINQGHLTVLYCIIFCLTGGSTLTSQDYDPSSVVYVSKPTSPLLISTDFLKYPFWHLFQTEKKIQL